MIHVTELAFCCYAVTDTKRARACYEGDKKLLRLWADINLTA